MVNVIYISVQYFMVRKKNSSGIEFFCQFFLNWTKSTTSFIQPNIPRGRGTIESTITRVVN